VRLGVSLDQVVAILIPIVKATVHHHAGHVLAVEYQDAVAPDAESVSDLVVGFPGNGFDNSVIQLPASGPEAPVSFHVLTSGGKRGAHESPILAEPGGQLKRECENIFSMICHFFSCIAFWNVLSFIFNK
jgi:hypothetical protein